MHRDKGLRRLEMQCAPALDGAGLRPRPAKRARARMDMIVNVESLIARCSREKSLIKSPSGLTAISLAVAAADAS